MKFKLRPWNKNDIESLVTYANNPKISANLTDQFPSPYSKVDGEKFIQMATEDKPIQIFAIEVNAKAGGAIGLFPQPDIHFKNMEIGYWLAEEFWGQGITTEAVKETVDYGFNTFKIDRIFARPFGTNISSQRVLEKAGFKLEGKFEKILFKNGEYLDELIYAIRR